MTKFEEILRKIKPRKKFLEFNAGITYWYCLSDLIQKFGNWHSDEEFKELLDKYNNLNNLKLQQQALPVVPECVAEFIESYKDRRTIYGVFDKISKNRKTYPKLYEWVFEDENSQATFALAFITGKYEVEKPQLFYLKNKLTTSYLALDINTGYYEHWGEEIIPKLLKKQGYEISFTQQEIDSMQTGSYELVPVEDEE
ncbi:DUF1642 domain-containing protein [Lactococcus lactis]|uniref:DUF1642 domain-containing protein n=1 Tax=Lactococcus lactis TaxID=1358 RepID=UPI00288E0BAB|nr:DUF1642 domain-containing protein [Lactococcus lactis]MDT2939229.1 DUF1642 domain-containing protein [Lactococcus lactis]